MTVTAERLRELLSYDEETGEFVWRVRRGGRAYAGTVAGTVMKIGYRHIRIGGKFHYAHRLAWFYVHGRWPTHQIDHVDRDRQNNRISNLREATNAENGRNSIAAPRNTSGFKGVSWHRNCEKWKAQIKYNGRQMHIGLFDSAEAAHDAYAIKAKKLHGKFARAA